MKAETRHRHPRSTDNAGAPEGWARTYRMLADVARANAASRAQGPLPPGEAGYWEGLCRAAAWWARRRASRRAGSASARTRCSRSFPRARAQAAAHIAWSLRGDGVPLLEQLPDGWMRFLDDPKTLYHRWSCRCGYKEHSAENYPEVAPGTCPVAGGKLPLDALVKAVRATAWGAWLSHFQVARLVNHPLFRRQFGLDGCRYASKSGVAKCTARAIAAGEMDRDANAVRYRRGRRWLTDTPAHYAVAGHWSPEVLERIGGLIGQIMPEVLEKLCRPRPHAPPLAPAA